MPQAQATQNAQPATGTDAVPAPNMTLAEMTRVMDVATTLRKERIEVQKQFNLEDTKRLLREKLLATAEVTGEKLTPQEIDAAIDSYFANLHAFEEPESSWQTWLAHLYVSRGPILRTIGWAIGIAAILWGYIAGSQYLKVSRANHEIQAALNASYEIVVVQDSQSGIDRFSAGESDGDAANLSGYYLIVEAVSSDGTIRAMNIRDAETGKTKRVKRWGEQVPQAVYTRVAADKGADGIVDDRLFAKKESGETDISIQIAGEDGTPIERGRQITSW